MTRSRVLAAAALVAVAQICGGCRHDDASSNVIHSTDANAPTLPLVTGKFIEDRLDAVASQDVGSMVANLVPAANGRFALSTDVGHRESVWAIDTATGKGTGSMAFPNGGKNSPKKFNGLYWGLAVDPDGSTVYAAQGSEAAIARLRLGNDGSLKQDGVIGAKPGDFPSGLAVDGRGYLYSASNDPAGKGLPFNAPGAVVIYNTKTADADKEVGRFTFADTVAGTSNFPLGVAALKDGSRVYVGSQRDACVYAIDCSDPKKPKLAKRIATGSHPIALLLSRDQSTLYVANAHSDTVSIVSTTDDAVRQTVLLRPQIASDLPGATPTGLALSPDERTLYASLGDMNAVAVIDLKDAELAGYVPAGWYPTGVVVSPDGKRLLVSNMKGNKPRNPNPTGPTGMGYSLQVLEATVTTVNVPAGPQQLKDQTQRVLELNKLTPHYVKAANPLAKIGLQAGKIKHVIYIVKENRTYDQVLGDLPQGNGDARLCLFPRDVTPNLHAIAERFVLLDNFYDCGEVSGDGWTWSTQGHANEYTIRNVPYNYGGRGRIFDFEGTNNEYPVGGFPAMGSDGKPLADHPAFAGGTPAIVDVAAAPGGHIWDDVIKAKLSYRNYGFFVANGVKRQGKVVTPDNYPADAALQPGGHDLEGVTDVDYRKFDLEYSDSEAGQRYFEETGDKRFLQIRPAFGKYNAPSRFSEWNREFQMMLKKDPAGGAVPTFMTVRLGDDHTVGANPDKHSPRSMVADNDFAVGQLVEAISHSPIWKETAIFVIEDDAQNGPDHVDAHRSTCFVISPWIKRGSVDHSFQNTVSCLKTIECLLGLPPMSQYDAVATPIMNWDDAPRNDEAYVAVAANKKWIADHNAGTNAPKPVSPELKSMMERSERMDFSVADRAPADELSQVIWETVKGPGSVMPSSPHGPKSAVVRKQKDDDDD